MEILIISKINDSGIYFIFRPCGSEVEVNVKGSYPVASKKLTNYELNYINSEIYLR